jgi:hypothetical protein
MNKKQLYYNILYVPMENHERIYEVHQEGKIYAKRV